MYVRWVSRPTDRAAGALISGLHKVVPHGQQKADIKSGNENLAA